MANAVSLIRNNHQSALATGGRVISQWWQADRSLSRGRSAEPGYCALLMKPDPMASVSQCSSRSVTYNF